MRRRRPVDPDAARRLARTALTRLARQRDSIGHDIHETAQAAHDIGLTFREIGDALGLRSPGAAWHLANDPDHDEHD